MRKLRLRGIKRCRGHTAGILGGFTQAPLLRAVCLVPPPLLTSALTSKEDRFTEKATDGKQWIPQGKVLASPCAQGTSPNPHSQPPRAPGPTRGAAPRWASQPGPGSRPLLRLCPGPHLATGGLAEGVVRETPSLPRPLPRSRPYTPCFNSESVRN